LTFRQTVLTGVS